MRRHSSSSIVTSASSGVEIVPVAISAICCSTRALTGFAQLGPPRDAALLTQMSTGPSSASACASAASTSALSETSAVDGHAAAEPGGEPRRARVDVHDRHPRTLLREPDGDRLADPRAAARDDRNLALEPHVCLPCRARHPPTSC